MAISAQNDYRDIGAPSPVDSVPAYFSKRANGNNAVVVDGLGNLPSLSAVAFDSSGRKSTYQLPNGKHVGITYASGKVLQAGSLPPWMYMSANGPINFMLQTNIRGFGFAVNGVIHCISSQDRKYYRYTTAAGWSGPLSAAIDSSGGIFSSMYIDSRGYLFASWQTPSRRLYRSIDGGLTWGEVMNTTQMPATNDYAKSITEADNGNLFCSLYNSVDGAGTSVNAIYKSTDGGATWVNITANLAFQYLRHVHTIWWDRHRRCLWANGGDGVPAMLQASTDYGTTWVACPLSEQSTAITADAEYLYYCADKAGDHGIYRMRGATAAEICAAVPRRVFRVSEVAGTDGTEFAWNADVNSEGIVVFAYSFGAKAFVAASADQGLSWTDVYATAVAGTVQFDSEIVRVSQYASGWDGFRISAGNGASYATRWRVYPSAMSWLVNPNTGDDDFGNGVSLPTKKIPEDGVKPQAVVTLGAAYPYNAALGLTGLVLDTAGNALGVPVSGTPLVSETFEATSSLTTTTAAGGTVDQTSTTNPYAGLRCARCITAASGGSTALVVKANALTSIASGDDAWIMGYFSLATVTITSVPYIMQVQSCVNLYVDLTSSGGGLMVQTSADSRFYRQHPDAYVAFPQAQYVKVKMRVKVHATLGEIEVWQNGQQVLYVKGINTLNTGPTTSRWGISSAQVLTMDVDNVLASKNYDPENPPAWSLNGRGQLLIRENIRSDLS